MGDFTKQDAEAKGWTIVHEGFDEEAEGVTLNATVWRAEKYTSPPGRAGAYIEAQAHSEQGLLDAIAFREQQFGVSDEGNVLVPKAGEDETQADTSDESTFERIADEELSRMRDNDVLTVLSDPSDPESDPKQVVISGGNEVEPTDYETSADAVPEASEPVTDADGNLVPTDQVVAQANQAGIDSAKESRDNADSAEDASNSDADAAAAEARHDAQSGDPGNSGNDTETVQPEAGAATAASDSEQQSQVPDAEAASSDAVSTNTTDAFPKDNASQPSTEGSDTDAEAPAAAPNAQTNASETTKATDVPPSSGDSTTTA